MGRVYLGMAEKNRNEPVAFCCRFVLAKLARLILIQSLREPHLAAVPIEFTTVRPPP